MNKKGRCLEDKDVRKALTRQTTLTDGLSFAMATGTWSTMLVDKRSRPGICQIIQAGSPIVPLSQLLRIKSSIRPDQKLTKPRLLHHTSFGRICPVATPEGASVGLEANLALGASISMQADSDAVLQLVARHIVTDCGCYVFLRALVGAPEPRGAVRSRAGPAKARCDSQRRVRGPPARRAYGAAPAASYVRFCGSRPCQSRICRWRSWNEVHRVARRVRGGRGTVAMSREEIDRPATTWSPPRPHARHLGSMVPFVGHKPPARTVYQCGMASRPSDPR